MFKRTDKVAEALANLRAQATQKGYWGDESEGYRAIDLGDGNGHFHIKAGEEFELVDDKPVLKPVYQKRYAQLGPCLNGFAYAKELGEDGKWGHIVVESGLPSYEFYLRFTGSVHEDVAVAKFDEHVWGHINPQTGKAIYEQRYLQTNDFTSGRAPAVEWVDEEKGLIGQFHIKLDGTEAYLKRYANVGIFNEITGKAVAVIGGKDHNIDCDGKDCGLTNTEQEADIENMRIDDDDPEKDSDPSTSSGQDDSHEASPVKESSDSHEASEEVSEVASDEEPSVEEVSEDEPSAEEAREKVPDPSTSSGQEKKE